MSFPHEVIAAFPTGGDPDPGLIRNMCTRRFAYALAAGEPASDFVAKDPVSGIPPLNLISGGTLFAYDEADSTTAPSDVCLVTSDACRYKSGSVELPHSVLTYGTTAQPADVDVSDGDTFLLPIGATGADWAGKAGQIAIRKSLRWYFAISPIGRKLYVEDEDAFYYRNDSGVWTAGNGSIALAANSVKITNVLGAKASFVVKVENQTTNAPPASPVAPVAYIIGSSPTGAWAGKAGQLAYCLVDGAYTYIVPDEGDEVWDKTLNTKFVFNGTAWISAAGAWIAFKKTGIDAGTFTYTGTVVGYTYSATTPPTINNDGYEDSATITHQASKSGATLRFRYRAAFTTNGANAAYTIALFRANAGGTYESNAVDWQRIYSAPTIGEIDREFIIETTDAATHIYKIKTLSNGTSIITAASRRRLTLEESSI